MTARGQVTAWAQGQGGALQGTGSGGAHTRVEEMLRGFLEEKRLPGLWQDFWG